MIFKWTVKLISAVLFRGQRRQQPHHSRNKRQEQKKNNFSDELIQRPHNSDLPVPSTSTLTWRLRYLQPGKQWDKHVGCSLLPYRRGRIRSSQGNRNHWLTVSSQWPDTAWMSRQSSSEESRKPHTEENVQEFITPDRRESFILLLPR